MTKLWVGGNGVDVKPFKDLIGMVGNIIQAAASGGLPWRP